MKAQTSEKLARKKCLKLFHYGQDFKYRVVDWHYQYYMGPKEGLG